MNRKKRIILTLFLSILIIISICLSVSLTKKKNTNDVYTEDTNTNDNSGMFAIMLETEAGSGVYEKSTTSTWPGDGYVFNVNLSSCENGGELSWNEELGAVNLKTNNTERCYVYFDMEIPIPTLAEYIINNVYIEDGVNGLYYHDGQGTYINADQEAGDNSYRYAGANPNNYVCFGSDEEACLEDNLYRIIGVFGNEVKLIKNTSIGNYAWDSGSNNTWEPNSGTYPDIKSILNSTFLETLNATWQNRISTHTWKVGGMVSNQSSTVKQYYNTEIGNSSSSITDSMKIGLMYVSDYGYAASNNYWPTALYNYDGGANNSDWMYLGFDEWTISRDTSNPNIAFRVLSSGAVRGGYVIGIGGFFAVRPVFYLNADVAYASGDGSQENPFRIE